MSQNVAPAPSAKPSAAPAGSSPKPKPNVAKTPPVTPSASSPKPKPNVAGRPSANLPGSGPRLAPFETYRRDIASGTGSKATTAGSDMMTKPVAKKRLINIFPGGSAKL